jgi:PAS domain S-box-containing protein
MADTLRVLYVDDETDLLEIGKLFLEESGDFSITTIGSAPAALELLTNEKFDAIISDYQMPGMDGIQLLIEVREKFGAIPFILFTGKGREEVVIQAINSGADFYLQKGGEPGAQFAELSHKIKQAALRNKTEDSLRKSEEKYRHLIEHANEAIVVAQDGMLKLVNKRAIEVTGYSEQELLSVPFSDIINPVDRAMVIERYQKRLIGEELSSRYPFRVVSKEGNTCWVELSAVVIDWDGRPATLNFISDVTERKKAEEALRESEEVLTAMLNGITESAFMMTPEGTILAANETVARRLGLKHSDDLVGQNAITLLPGDIQEARKEKVDEVLKSGQPVHFEDVRSDRVIDQTIYPIRGPDGTVDRLTVFGIDITKRKKAEEALIESEERFRLITETIDEAFWMADVDIGKIFYVSPSFERIWGRSRESLYKNPRSFIDAIHMEDRERVLANFEIQKSGLPFDHEYRILHPDGNIRHIWDRGFPLRDENGQVSRYVGVAVDVTERKRTERALAEREELFRSLVHNSSDLTILTDANGSITYVSPQCERVLGYPAEKILGQKIPDVIHPEDTARCHETWEQVAHQGLNLHEFEYRIIDGSGAVRWISHSASQTVVNGRVLGMQNTIRDITERKQAEKAQQENVEKYRGIFDESVAAVYVFDNKKNFINSNQAGLDLLGYSREELLQMSIPDVDADPVVVLPAHQELLSGGRLINYEHSLRRKDETLITVINNSSPLTDPHGNVVGMISTLIDITGRKRAEDALKHQSGTLLVLNDIISTANKADDLPVLLNSILDESLRLLDFDAGGIYLVDRSTRTANIVHSKNLSSEFLAEIRTLPIDKEPFDTLFIQNEPIITENYEKISPERAKKFGFKSVASIPLLSKGVAVGALNIASLKRQVIPEEIKQTLTSIGRELGSTIERVTAEEEAKKAKKI